MKLKLKTVFVCALAAVIGLAGLLALVAWRWFTIDTSIYAPGFSEDVFQRIEVGMSRTLVYELLGPPISQQNVDSPESWSYGSPSIRREWFSIVFDLTGEYQAVEFDALGRVIEVYGDSLRPLIREGMKKREVRDILGEPTEVYPQTSEVLHYSSPTDWGTYRARIISIDSNGLVSQITTYDVQD